MQPKKTVKSSIHWHFWRNRLFLLTKNALLTGDPNNRGVWGFPCKGGLRSTFPDSQSIFFFRHPVANKQRQRIPRWKRSAHSRKVTCSSSHWSRLWKPLWSFLQVQCKCKRGLHDKRISNTPVSYNSHLILPLSVLFPRTTAGLKSHVNIDKSIFIHNLRFLQEIACRPLALSRYVWQRNYLHSVVMIIIHHLKIISQAFAWPTTFINAYIIIILWVFSFIKIPIKFAISRQFSKSAHGTDKLLGKEHVPIQLDWTGWNSTQMVETLRLKEAVRHIYWANYCCWLCATALVPKSTFLKLSCKNH